jgi:hypothetical protein
MRNPASALRALGRRAHGIYILFVGRDRVKKHPEHGAGSTRRFRLNYDPRDHRPVHRSVFVSWTARFGG